METISRRWVVLNDHERRTLRAVEHQFRAEDPEFTRLFEARQARQARLLRHPQKLGVNIAIVVAVLLAVLMLVVGSLAGALGFVVATGLIWLAWSHSAGPDRKAP
jgi:Flp pilus assembly protein TadB